MSKPQPRPVNQNLDERAGSQCRILRKVSAIQVVLNLPMLPPSDTVPLVFVTLHQKIIFNATS